jgi:hypothetical protein
MAKVFIPNLVIDTTQAAGNQPGSFFPLRRLGGEPLDLQSGIDSLLTNASVPLPIGQPGPLRIALSWPGTLGLFPWHRPGEASGPG